MRYWMFKCSIGERPSARFGDWIAGVFSKKGPVQWGGHSSTKSPTVWRLLDNKVAAGDVVVAYQSDLKSVVGFCRIKTITGEPGDRKLWLKPLEVLAAPFPIHDHKARTCLAGSHAVDGHAMLAELTVGQMRALLSGAGATPGILEGVPGPDGWKPRTQPRKPGRKTVVWPVPRGYRRCPACNKIFLPKPRARANVRCFECATGDRRRPQSGSSVRAVSGGLPGLGKRG